MASVSERQDKALPVLAAELRTALTPVLGYLELILDDFILDPNVEALTEQHLEWVDSVERQLHNLRGLSAELIEVCGTWRNECPAGLRNGTTDVASRLEQPAE